MTFHPRAFCALWILSLFFFSGCNLQSLFKKGENAGGGGTLVSDDQMIEVSLPDGWSSNKGLHEGANLQAGNLKEDIYIVILSENKADFENMDLQKHSDTTRNILVGNLQTSTVSEPTQFKVGEFNALQYEVSGTFSNINLIYLHTTIDTGSHFHQILTWTTKSKFAANKEVFQNLIKSFKLRPGATPPPTTPSAPPSGQQ